MWEAFWPALKDALNTEVEVEVCSEYINAVAECIQELGAQVRVASKSLSVTEGYHGGARGIMVNQRHYGDLGVL